MSNQIIPNHLLGEILDLLRCFADLDSALKTAGEGTLATTASLDLGLKDKATLVGKA
jgi:hypothetical protein